MGGSEVTEGKLGRESKMTEKALKDLEGALQTGAPIRDACTYAGIDDSTYFLWMAIGGALAEGRSHKKAPKDEVARKRYTDFFERMKKAQVTARINALAVINFAASEEWQAAAWLLERTDPENFARRSIIKLEGGVTAELVNDLVKALKQKGLDPVEVLRRMLDKVTNGETEKVSG